MAENISTFTAKGYLARLDMVFMELDEVTKAFMLEPNTQILRGVIADVDAIFRIAARYILPGKRIRISKLLNAGLRVCAKAENPEIDPEYNYSEEEWAQIEIERMSRLAKCKYLVELAVTELNLVAIEQGLNGRDK